MKSGVAAAVAGLLRVLCALTLAVAVWLPLAVRADEPFEPARLEREVLVAACTDPMQLEVLADGSLLFIERGGAVRWWDAAAGETHTLGHVPVAVHGEVGLLGLATDLHFAENAWIYLFFCPQEQPESMRLARFTLARDAETGRLASLDPTSAETLLTYPIDARAAIHMGGGLARDAAGLLYLGTGDNCPPIPELPVDQRPGQSLADAFSTSANSADLRGKILRIRPEADGGFTIPEGNLFPGGQGGRPEIFCMGCRNPFRLSVDDATGEVWWGDVGAQHPAGTRHRPQRRLFFYDWTRNWIMTAALDAAGEVAAIEPFMPEAAFRKPIDMKIGPEGALYLAEYGDTWGSNTDATISRIVYRRGNRRPRAHLAASATAGREPLDVEFDASRSFDPDAGDDLRFRWIINGDEVAETPAASLSATFPAAGRQQVEVVAVDAAGLEARASLTVLVGNARPEVSFLEPAHGSFVAAGETVRYALEVTDAEDGSAEAGSIAAGRVLLSRESRLRARPGACDGRGGAERVEVFEREAGSVMRLGDGDWIAFADMRLDDIGQVVWRAAASGCGGTLSLRLDAPDGEEIARITLQAEDDALGETYRTQATPIGPVSGLRQVYVVATDLEPGKAAGAERGPLPPKPLSLAWLRFEDRPEAVARKAAVDEVRTKILLVATAPDHPYATHMYAQVCELLAACLNQTPGVEAVVSPDLDWPQDPAVLEDVDAIVYYSRPAGDIVLSPQHREAFVKLMQQGVGFTAIHWSTAAEEAVGPLYERLLGGWFNFAFCGLKVDRLPLVQKQPEHPVCRGWRGYDLRDEFYLNLKFDPRAEPVLTVTVDDVEQMVAWVLEREGGGRSFGTTLGHFHDNYAIPEFRRAIVNGILWTAIPGSST